MTLSIVDRLNETDDLRHVPEHWDMLISPIITALEGDVQPSEVETLYVEPDGNRAGTLTYFGAEALSDLPSSWHERFLVLSQQENRPLILLGDPGVGKTVWLTRFLRHLGSESTVSCVHYDHNARVGALAAAHLSPGELLRGYVESKLLEVVVQAIRAVGFKDHFLYGIQASEFIAEPNKVSPKIEQSLQDTVSHLYEQYRKRVFVVIDNIDLCDLALQRTAVDHASFLSQWKGLFPIISLRPATYHKLHLHLRRPVLYSVARPPLDRVLERRLLAVWPDPKGSESVKKILGHLRNVKLHIPWGPAITSDPKPLRDLHHLLMAKVFRNNNNSVMI